MGYRRQTSVLFPWSFTNMLVLWPSMYLREIQNNSAPALLISYPQMAINSRNDTKLLNIVIRSWRMQGYGVSKNRILISAQNFYEHRISRNIIITVSICYRNSNIPESAIQGTDTNIAFQILICYDIDMILFPTGTVHVQHIQPSEYENIATYYKFCCFFVT